MKPKWEVEYNERIWPADSRKDARAFVQRHLETITLHQVGRTRQAWDGTETDYARTRGGHVAATVRRVVRQADNGSK